MEKRLRLVATTQPNPKPQGDTVQNLDDDVRWPGRTRTKRSPAHFNHFEVSFEAPCGSSGPEERPFACKPRQQSSSRTPDSCRSRERASVRCPSRHSDNLIFELESLGHNFPLCVEASKTQAIYCYCPSTHPSIPPILYTLFQLLLLAIFPSP